MRYPDMRQRLIIDQRKQVTVDTETVQRYSIVHYKFLSQTALQQFSPQTTIILENFVLWRNIPQCGISLIRRCRELP